MKTKKLRCLAIICGGTGGHFYPGLTIARAFHERDNCKVIMFIGGHKINTQIKDAEKFKIHIEEVDSARISKNPLKLVKFITKFLQGYFKGRKLLKKNQPDAILGMGSFTSLTVALAAKSLKIPLFLHDGNARVGRANIFLSKWSEVVMTAFPPVNSNLIKCDYCYTGMPIRPELTAFCKDKVKDFELFNGKYNCRFNSEVRTILIFGGSQGAATINRVLPKTVSKLSIKNLQVIHLIGKNSLNSVHEEYRKSQLEYLVLAYCDDMALLYSIADIVVCRSGGSTIAELLFYEKPAILIPYPLAADLHQNDNAEFYKKTGLAEIVLNSECNVEKMKLVIEQLYLKVDSKIEENFNNLQKSNVTDKIIELIDSKLVIQET